MLDSGASNHYTLNRDLFVSFHKTKPTPIETASTILFGEGAGDVILNLTCGTIQITNVIYVPKMIKHTSLILIGQLKQRGLTFSIDNGVWKMWRDGSLWAVAKKENNVYFLKEVDTSNKEMVSFPAMGNNKEPRRTNTQAMETWHKRMGHLNKKYIVTLKTLANGMDFGQEKKYTLNCDECIKSNQGKQISRFPIRQATKCLEIIYADLCGPMQEPHFWANRYYAVFVDAKSRYKWIYLMATQDEVTVNFNS